MKPRNIFTISAIFVMAVFLGVAFQSRVSAQQAGETKADEKKGASVADEFSDVEVTGWRIRDFKPYIKAIQELEKLNKEYSDNLLKLAIDEYSTAIDILEDMENEVIKIKASNKEKKNLNERFYWQEIDRKNQEQRQVAAKKYEAKMKAVTYLTKSIDYLDQIQHVEIRQESRFLNFQSRLFQVYVSTQYDLQNFKPCIPILERYIAISDKNAKDIWAYKYMASCYGYMEKVLAKYRHANEDEINTFKNKKNRSMLQAVELKYGVESPHYKHMQEIVEQDEKKAERINDFK
ncbi:MAG TPA: hypothetical protein PK307_16765 [Spirochaetota bacterium]|nr:hypothetical protein [Spirochaetota bacterium]HOD15649.1 hypothetical protein [Spirochaetota bacterium]HPG50753.1 hypothetical protein [Spirochaetota bacterium]HPN12602.1 hypothetical protein [Spirochaetota bacterium]HQL83854.1 hypothetical protein [Spirochaetota bacterium]